MSTILVREPDAGKLQVRFDEREVETEPTGHRATSRLYPFSPNSLLRLCVEACNWRHFFGNPEVEREASDG